MPAIYKHIKVLEAADLLLRKKSGRTNFLTIKKKTVVALQRWIMQYNAYWGNDQETLDNYVEGISNNI